MDELIKIEKIEGNKTVNARDLWEFLEVKTKFSDWISRRISELFFIQGSDYITILKNEFSPPMKEYFLNLSMAKELSMLERNAKGKHARLYFIQCEKELLESNRLPDFKDPAEAAEAWAQQFREKTKAQLELKEAQPKIEFHDQLEASEDSIPVADFANILVKKGVEIGEKRLFKFFYVNKYLINSKRPYQICLESKWMEVREYTYLDHNEKERIGRRVLITGKGQTYFAKIVKDHFPCNPVQTSF